MMSSTASSEKPGALKRLPSSLGGNPEDPEPNRYSALAPPGELRNWWRTFVAFDRDGGGDVDLKELGLMFRQLGHTPNEAMMRQVIAEVDFDASGTVDFEEFCLLMLRQLRQAQIAQSPLAPTAQNPVPGPQHPSSST